MSLAGLINLAMLVTFLVWGVIMPRLVRHGIGAVKIVAWGVPLPLALLVLIVVQTGDPVPELCKNWPEVPADVNKYDAPLP